MFWEEISVPAETKLWPWILSLAVASGTLALAVLVFMD
jgi:hypothetical protein